MRASFKDTVRTAAVPERDRGIRPTCISAFATAWLRWKRKVAMFESRQVEMPVEAPLAAIAGMLKKTVE